MSLTNTTEAQILNHLLRFQEWQKPIDIYVALFKASPGATGSLDDEVDGDSYARVRVGPHDDDWDPPEGGLFRNAEKILFSDPLEDWGQVSHFALCDADTGGNVWVYAALDVALEVNEGSDAPQFNPGDLRIGFSGHLTNDVVEALGNHLLRSATWPLPGELYAALITSAGTEIDADDYERQPAYAWSEPDPDAGSYHDDYIVWPSPESDWGDAEQVALYNAGGTEQIRIPLDHVRTLPEGALAPNFPPEAIRIKVE